MVQNSGLVVGRVPPGFGVVVLGGFIVGYIPPDGGVVVLGGFIVGYIPPDGGVVVLGGFPVGVVTSMPPGGVTVEAGRHRQQTGAGTLSTNVSPSLQSQDSAT
jgi:hypothetical protein